MRPLVALLVSVLSCLACGEQRTCGSVAAFAARLADGGSAETDGERRHLRHRVRNAAAMVELVGAIPPGRRPSTIAYVAAGEHVAPLALCELAPPDQACRLIMTEVDPTVQSGIDAALADLQRAGCIQLGRAQPPIDAAAGTRKWSLRMGGRTVELELRVRDPGDPVEAALFPTALLREADLVVSHDWSGAPLENLQLIHRYLTAARRLDAGPPPLMIEDLSRHLYGVDLEPFVPLARTDRAYGHRDADAGLGRHGSIELGPPVFGGGVLLGFADPWWRKVDAADLEGVLDFLLFCGFDTDRQNVLRGGSDVLLAPRLVDWWTGFGARGVDGRVRRPGEAFRAAMVRSVVRAADAAGVPVRRRFACLLRMYRALLVVRATGENALELMPSARLTGRPDPGDFPSEQMERAYRRALRRVELFREERAVFRKRAARLVEVLRQGTAGALVDECLCAGGTPVEEYINLRGRLLDQVAVEPPEPSPKIVRSGRKEGDLSGGRGGRGALG